MNSFLQLTGAGCLMVVVLTHIFEALNLFPRISFGGVIAFILADLIVLPVLNIYRKYYGLKMAAFLFATFYAAMAAAALIVEAIFGVLGLVPEQRHARVAEAAIQWNYTTWLNIAFLLLAALFVWRFLRTGGPRMLGMMNGPAERPAL